MEQPNENNKPNNNGYALSDESITQLKNKLEVLFAEFGLSNYALFLNNGEHMLNVANIDGYSPYDMLTLIGSMMSLSYTISGEFAININHYMASLQMERIQADLANGELIVAGMMDYDLEFGELEEDGDFDDGDVEE